MLECWRPELWRKPGAFAAYRVRIALAALWLLAAAAIYAPLIASDEPFYLRAVDVGAMRRAASELPALAQELSTVAASSNATPEQLERACAAIESRVATIARDHDSVDGHLASVAHEARTACARATEGDWDAVRKVAARAEQQARDVGAFYEARAAAVSRDDPWQVRSSRSPWLESRSWLELFAMLAWPLVAIAALESRWRRAMRIAVPAAALAAWLGPLAWQRPAGLHTTPIKAALASGDLLAESAWFAPVPFGFDETNSSEALRPPTWLASSEIDDAGRYVRGPRRVEAASDFAPVERPVRVLPHEPELNSTARHVLGTDALGRDVLARVLWGARTSLGIGFAGAALVLALGVVIGAAAGWFGRAVDFLLSRVIEVLASFPAVFVIVVAAALVPASRLAPELSISLVVGLLGWTSIARLMRAEVLRVRELEFVAAARVLGLSDARILARHVLPNAIQPVLAAAAFVVGWAIFLEAGVSFLGFGVAPPAPSWGNLLGDTREAWWLQAFPGTAIAVTVLALHVVGEALRDALDPRHVSER